MCVRVCVCEMKCFSHSCVWTSWLSFGPCRLQLTWLNRDQILLSSFRLHHVCFRLKADDSEQLAETFLLFSVQSEQLFSLIELFLKSCRTLVKISVQILREIGVYGNCSNKFLSVCFDVVLPQNCRLHVPGCIANERVTAIEQSSFVSERWHTPRWPKLKQPVQYNANQAVMMMMRLVFCYWSNGHTCCFRRSSLCWIKHRKHKEGLWKIIFLVQPIRWISEPFVGLDPHVENHECSWSRWREFEPLYQLCICLICDMKSGAPE